jgi:hypothetical protein
VDDGAISTAPSHPRLKVYRRLGATKPRNMVRVSGIAPPIPLSGFNRDINTLEMAVKERVFFVKENNVFTSPPLPAHASFAEILKTTRTQLGKYLPKTVPLTRQKFVDTFRGRKLVIYKRAFLTLLQGKVSKKLAKVKVFAKYEKTQQNKVPRVVSPRSPEYNIEVGRYTRAVEKLIYKALDTLFGHPTVIKGYNATYTAKILREKFNMFKNPVCIGLDAKRFDQHVSKQALQFEHDVYLTCFPIKKHKRQLSKLLSWQLTNDCVGYCPDGKLKYRVDGCRMSGDMNTGLGNTVLMCTSVHQYAQNISVTIQLANNGDDCVVIMERDDLLKFTQHINKFFLTLGFTMVVEEPVYKFEQIEFCQTHPVFLGPGPDDYIMVRHPKLAIAKDTTCLKNWTTPKMHLGWLHAVGTGGLAMTGGIPIFQDFYSKYLEYGKIWKKVGQVQGWGVRKLSEGLNLHYKMPTPETRASFYYAFGVTPDEQLCIEKFYRNVKMSCNILLDLEYQIPQPL